MTKNEDGTVILTLDEYKDLVRDSDKLLALENWGVDNWSGYSEAMQEFYANEDTED